MFKKCLAAFAALMVCAGQTAAYENREETPTTRWDSGAEIVWRYSELDQPPGISTEDAVTVLIAATRRWEKVVPVRFKFAGVTRETMEASEKCSAVSPVVIGWGSGHPKYPNMAAFARPCSGKTDASRIVGGTIEFTATKPELSTSSTRLGTLDVIATHEIGHLLGLEHSNDPDSIMRPKLEEAQGSYTRGELSNRDMAVAAVLYKAGMPELGGEDWRDMYAAAPEDIKVRFRAALIPAR